ncbi:unnamed protein product [Prorocentrum cordatum]|uniref:Uncharacterized protein n=1 Tax=Prorocentrum cordatum TaxID=2364126 RepID=A0ABN9WZ69_9DINO|nr:unnamed protein product [Polarella glacialis]
MMLGAENKKRSGLQRLPLGQDSRTSPGWPPSLNPKRGNRTAAPTAGGSHWASSVVIPPSSAGRLASLLVHLLCALLAEAGRARVLSLGPGWRWQGTQVDWSTMVKICPLRGAGQSAPAEKLTPMVLKKSFFTRGRLACGDVPKFWCVRVAHPISWLEQTG